MGWACISPALPGSSGSSSGQRLLCILGMHLRMSSWLCLAQHSVWWRSCALVFPLPPLPIQGSRGLSSLVFSIKLTVHCDSCLIWGLGWRAGLVDGLRGRAGLWGVPPTWIWAVGFSPRSLGTQPPFATQALMLWWSLSFPNMVDFLSLAYTIFGPLGAQVTGHGLLIDLKSYRSSPFSVSMFNCMSIVIEGILVSKQVSS